MVRVLLYLWQLPQNLLGLFILGINKSRVKRVKVWYVERGVAGCGVSLGNYIILHKKYDEYPIIYDLNTVILHESGHQKQSQYFGWFYLLLVGLPSLCNNIWDRLFHKKWDYDRRVKWYYSRYPEKWADQLGGVERRM